MPAWWGCDTGNTRVGRYLRAPSSLGRDIHKHCHEEMRVLASFLPEAYAKHLAGTGAQ